MHRKLKLHGLASVLAVAGAAAMAAAPVLAQTYKWVDERGVTNYGEKPPPGRPSQQVDTQPSGTIESGSLNQQKSELDRRRPVQVYGPPPPPPPQASPPPQATHGMRFDTFVYLRRGMSEGELLLRAGPPDYSSVENFQDAIVKSFYYYPTPEDPFLTVVTLRGGRIARIDRTRKIY